MCRKFFNKLEEEEEDCAQILTKNIQKDVLKKKKIRDDRWLSLH